MKSQKKSFFKILLFSLLTNLAFAQANLNGTSLCDQAFAFLQKNNVQAQVQPLAAGGTNNLPYNIIVSFSPDTTVSDYNLVILFDMHQAWDNKELLLPLFEQLKTQNFNSNLVLCYESTLNVPRQNIIYGSDVFADSLNTNNNNAVLIFNLKARKNAIVSGSNGHHAPSWMIKDMFDAFSDAKLNDGLPLCFISQVADYTFSTDRRLLSFLELEIPCISADINDTDKAVQIITNCINSYDSSRFDQDDSHAFMFSFFGKRVWLSEYKIVTSLIIIIVMGFLLVFIVGFINRTLRKGFWKEVRANWYIIPVIYVLSTIGFFAGKGLYAVFVPASSTNYTVFGGIILELLFSMLLVSAFYMLNLSLLKKYTTRSLDFILVIVTFINQVVFTLLDISLFPIFLMIYIVSVISLIFRRNWIHIILFVFMVVPFVPYVNALFSISDTEKLHTFLMKSNLLPVVLSLALLPFYIMWLRILNAIKKRYAKKRIYAIVIGAMYIFIFMFILILNRIFYSNKKAPSREINVIELPEPSDSYDFELEYNDTLVFSDIIRHIKLTSPQTPVYTSLKVVSQNKELPPVLYSENDFNSVTTDSAVFELPLYPPQKLEFSYGSSEGAQTILAEQIFYEPTYNTFYSVTKTLSINDSSPAGGYNE